MNCLSDGVELYRCADLDICPIGDNQMLVHARQIGVTAPLSTATIKLLNRCRRFRTLAEHAQECCQDALAIESVQHQLRTLASQGFMVSYRSVLARCLQSEAPIRPTVPITTLAVPSHARVESLQRALQSFIENSLDHDRHIQVLVANDNPSEATRTRYQLMLRSLQEQYRTVIRYAGPSERRHFAQILQARGDIPPDIIDFALLSDPSLGITTVGTNRNAILLDTVGECFVSVDDDMVCRIAEAPASEEKLALRLGTDPALEIWKFLDRSLALQSAKFVAYDFLGLHEAWLGHSVQDCLATYRDRMDIDLDGLDSHSIHHVESGSGRVAITVSGLIGDCGSDQVANLLLGGESFKRLTQTEDTYHSLIASREIFYFNRHPVITDSLTSLMTGAIGLDNRTLLPPFSPYGRGQDGLFGSLILKCLEGHYVARIPVAILHDPTDARKAAETALFHVVGTLLNVWLRYFVKASHLGVARANGAEKLRRVGKQLEEIGSLPDAEFSAYVHDMLWQVARSGANFLEDRLRSSPQAPSFWATDMRRSIEQVGTALMEPDLAMAPVDLRSGRSLHEARSLTRQIVRQYGRLLYWWPDILALALDLRSHDQRLSLPVNVMR